MIFICYPAVGNDSVLDTIKFNTQNVRAAICKLKCNLLSGPDGLPPLLFKRLKHCLTEALALMFTQRFSVSTVPSDWKHAVITYVFKKGAAGSACNYRPK